MQIKGQRILSKFRTIQEYPILRLEFVQFNRVLPKLYYLIIFQRAAIWRFKEENRALMRRLYGEMDSPTLYREMRSTAEKSSTNHQSAKSQKQTKVIDICFAIL